MIIAIREDGEVRIFETEQDVQLEWGPYPRDIESDVAIFYAEDGTWLKPIFTEGAARWFGLRRGPITFRLARSTGLECEDPIGLALHRATTLVPNRYFMSLAELKAKFPFDCAPFEKGSH